MPIDTDQEIQSLKDAMFFELGRLDGAVQHRAAYRKQHWADLDGSALAQAEQKVANALPVVDEDGKALSEAAKGRILKERLAADPDYQSALLRQQQAKVELEQLDADLEIARARHRSYLEAMKAMAALEGGRPAVVIIGAATNEMKVG